MKKCLALLLALCMLCIAGAVLAEDGEVNPDNYEELYDFGFMFLRPDGFEDVDLTADEVAQGMYTKLTNEDETAAICIYYRVVNDSEGNPVEDPESLCALYMASGASSAEIVDVNGYEWVRYTVDSIDFIGMAYLYQEGAQLVFTFQPASSGLFDSTMKSIMEVY